MEYTIQRLAKLAGTTPRALRYYDEIDLLNPGRINSSGYRIYGQNEVDRLQQIMFYKELGVGLEEIKEILYSPNFLPEKALLDHYQKLLDKRKQIDQLISNVEKSILVYKGECMMSDKEKFEGFKQEMIDSNEEKYGREIREKYGDEAVDKSYQQIKNMTPEDQLRIEKLTEELNDTLKKAVDTNNPSGQLAMKACELHKQWLSFYWGNYSGEAHVGITQMYVDDQRFRAYYEKIAEGCAEFLRDAVLIYVTNQ